MDRQKTIRRRSLTAALVVGALRFGGPAGNTVTAAPSSDPCALLKPADVQTLAANAKIGGGSLTGNPPLGASCQYSWGPRTNEWGETTLSVLIVDGSKVWPGGLSADAIKQRVLADVRTGGPDASEIPGVGDGAVFKTDARSHNASAKAYLVRSKGVLLELIFHGGNPLAQKDKLIGLLKTAAATL